MKTLRPWGIALFILLIALVMAGCNRAQPTSTIPTPALPVVPTPLPIPKRPQVVLPTPVTAATPTSINESGSTGPSQMGANIGETPVEAPAAIEPDIAGWAYVKTLQARLRAEPAGNILDTLRAGQRLDILGASPDRIWLKVRYQPNPDQDPIIGWVLASQMQYYVDPAEIPVVDGAEESPSTPELSPQGKATVTARKLNFRAGPGVDQPIIGALTTGQIVSVLGRSDNHQWLKVMTEDGMIGWAAAPWLDSQVPIEDLPVIDQATTGVPKPATPKGIIAFQDRPGGSIYVMNADGTGLRKLTSGLDPALSPDGKQIAFTRWGGNGDTVRVIQTDGRGERMVIGADKPRSPTWTPDGQNLIFEFVVKDTYCRDTPLGCATDEQIRKEFNGNDCWTYPPPIGTYCIWDFPVVHFFITSLASTAVNGTSVRNLPTNQIVYTPRHHPIYPEVLHLTRDGIAVAYTQDNRPPKLLVEYGYLGAPVYSPDGKYIYVSRKDGDHWNIWRYNNDGTGPVALTRPPLLRDRPINNVAPAVSPDGKFILFLTDRRGKWEMWIMNSDGSNQRPFAPRSLAGIQFDFDFSRARMIDWK